MADQASKLNLDYDWSSTMELSIDWRNGYFDKFKIILLNNEQLKQTNVRGRLNQFDHPIK